MRYKTSKSCNYKLDWESRLDDSSEQKTLLGIPCEGLTELCSDTDVLKRAAAVCTLEQSTRQVSVTLSFGWMQNERVPACRWTSDRVDLSCSNRDQWNDWESEYTSSLLLVELCISHGVSNSTTKRNLIHCLKRFLANFTCAKCPFGLFFHFTKITLHNYSTT